MLARVGFVLVGLAVPALSQTVQLVSQSTSGVQGNGDSRAPRISADGKWGVFKSDASTLVPGDSNGVGDIFLRHLDSGTTTLISIGVGGALANGESFSPAISADGSVIAFQSSATNLVTGDTNGKADIFVWEAGVNTRVSVGTGGVQSNGASDKPSLSGDGRYVAYESVGSNLIVGDTNGASDIFRFDRVTGSVVRASVSSTGAEANGASHAPWLNDNGAVVAFDSLATNLVGGDTNGSSDVFVRDVVGGATIAATVFSGFVGNGNSDTASISADGQLVAFRSDASNLTAGDTNGTSDVFLADPWNQQIWRVSEGTGGVQGNGAATFPQLAADGLFVAFTSAASNLVSGDTNARDDVFVHDVAAAKTKRISSDAYGVPGNGHSRAPSVASGGASTAFKSDASNLIAGDANGIGDVFVRRPAAMTWYVDASAPIGGDGSLSFPFVSLQSAINNASCASGDTVLIAPGIYFGGYDLGGRSLTLRGTGGSAQTVLDGELASTVISANQSADGIMTLEGLTILNGLGTFVDVFSGATQGGGMRITGGSLQMSDCIVRKCEAGDGAGMWIADCVVSLGNVSMLENAAYCHAGGASIQGGQFFADSCLFEGNFGGYGGCYPGMGGGGASVSVAGAVIDSCVFRGNNGTSYLTGAGLDLAGSGSVVRACTFTENWSQGSAEGGGARILGDDARVENCLFSGNSSYGALAIYGHGVSVTTCEFRGNSGGDNDGGGLLMVGGDGVVDNCIFDQNSAEWLGGGIYSWASQLVVRDCVFTRNTAGSSGGGGGAAVGAIQFERCVFALNGSLQYGDSLFAGTGTFTQCTIVNNPSAPGHEVASGILAFDSCIIWDNGAIDASSVTSALWCDYDVGFGGATNISSTPEFWDSETLDLKLTHASPCIDAGNPGLPLDADGSRADMGAIPFDPNYCGTPRVYCTAKLNSLGCTPSISWTGTPSLNGLNDDFHITASNVLNNKNGLLFWGTQDFGAPFQGGTLCVKPPIVRTDVQNSGGNPPPNDCSGTYDFHMSQAYMGASLFQSGTTIYAQYWSRDPGFSAPNNVGLTDALRVVVCP